MAVVRAVKITGKARSAPVQCRAVQGAVKPVFGYASLFLAVMQYGTMGQAVTAQPAAARIEKILLDHRSLDRDYSLNKVTQTDSTAYTGLPGAIQVSVYCAGLNSDEGAEQAIIHSGNASK